LKIEIIRLLSIKKLFLLSFLFISCNFNNNEIIYEIDDIESKNKVGIQFFLDVRYPEIYEKAYREYRDNLYPILDGASMYMAKIDRNILGNSNYINIVIAKNNEHLDTLLEKVSNSDYHKKYHLSIGLDKGDVKVISIVRFELQ